MPETVTHKLSASHFIEQGALLRITDIHRRLASGGLVDVKLAQLSKIARARYWLSSPQREILMAGGIINYVRPSRTASGT
jgi:hypothetical protein